MSNTFVYIIKSKERDEFKVGVSGNPMKRLASLQTARADELELLYTFPGTMETESELHNLLAEFRIRGEWFTRYTEAKPVILKYRPELVIGSIEELTLTYVKNMARFLNKTDSGYDSLVKLLLLHFYSIGRMEVGGLNMANTNPSDLVVEQLSLITELLNDHWRHTNHQLPNANSKA